MENAIDFYDDATRDVVDLNRKCTDIDQELLADLNAATTVIDPKRAPHKFKNISEAVEELNLKDYYGTNCKTLSKFVHPTAMSVIARIPKDRCHKIRNQFVDDAKNWAADAIKALDESCVGETYRKFKPHVNEFYKKHATV